MEKVNRIVQADGVEILFLGANATKREYEYPVHGCFIGGMHTCELEDEGILSLLYIFPYFHELFR